MHHNNRCTPQLYRSILKFWTHYRLFSCDLKSLLAHVLPFFASTMVFCAFNGTKKVATIAEENLMWGENSPIYGSDEESSLKGKLALLPDDVRMSACCRPCAHVSVCGFREHWQEPNVSQVLNTIYQKGGVRLWTCLACTNTHYRKEMQEQMRIAKKAEPRMHRLVEDTMQYGFNLWYISTQFGVV